MEEQPTESHNAQMKNIDNGFILKRNERKNYGLCGYLGKASDKSFKGIKYSTGFRKRWFVYSDKTCKLYMYRGKNDPEPLGEIDISLSTFSYDLENLNEKLFIISCGTDEYILEASSSNERLFWIQQLQAARQEFTQKLHQTQQSSNIPLGRPKSGLLQCEDVECLPDPYEDLVQPIPKPSTPEKFEHKSLLSTFSLPLALFRPSSNDTSRRSSTTSPSDSFSTPTSPGVQEINKFDKMSKKLRNSVRLMSKSTEEHSQKDTCRNCQKRSTELSSAYQEISALRDSCDAGRDAINILQHQIEVLQSEKETLKALDGSHLVDGDILDILRSKDVKIVELETSKLQLRNSLATLTANLRNSRIHSDNLQDKLEMLTSMVKVKEETVTELTQHLDAITLMDEASLGNSKFYPNYKDLLAKKDRADASTQTSQSEFTDLRDQLEGYRVQNGFLNKEILDLNLLRKQTFDREQKLISESSDWEAKFYQIQSKYLLLLNDLHSPQSLDSDSSVVPRLLQDLVQSYGSTDLRGVHKKGRDYDEFGFCIKASSETDLLTQAAYMQKRSMANANQAETASDMASLNSRWEAFVAGTGTKEMLAHPELKNLIRQGIPYQYKGKVWRLLITQGVHSVRASKPSSYYQTLLSQRGSSVDPFAKQIEVDLLRTLPNNRHYESPFSDGIAKLRRVLLAYSRHNLDVGYCQGLNRLAAVALLFLNEEDAFWALVYMIEILMPPSFYSNNLLGSQVDQRVLKDLIAMKLPNIHAHLEQHGLDVSLFTFNWFLCVYVDVIPPSTYLYIWDSFLFEGSKVLFRFALAIFKLCEDAILKKLDYLSIFNYLRSVPAPMLDVKQLHQMAFYWVNPLTSKYIKNRREFYTTVVRAELDEVEASRQAFKEAASKKERTATSPDDVINNPSPITPDKNAPEEWEFLCATDGPDSAAAVTDTQ